MCPFPTITAKPFINRAEEVDKLLEKARNVAKGSSLADADIESTWMHAYAQIARRARDNREFGFSRYPCEAVPCVGAFVGGIFQHKDWPLRRGLEGSQSVI